MSRFANLLEGAFALSGDAIFFLDRDGFIDCNDAALRLFGYDSKAEILKLHPGDLAPEVQPDGRQSLSAASAEMDEAFANGHALVEWQHKRRDGTVFSSEVMLVGFLLEGREALAATIRDVTRRKAAEEEVVKQREALHQSEKMAALGSLLAGIAHELNNPLSIVTAQSGLLKDTSSDPSVVARADRIGIAADRCARIIKSFLAMARERPPARTLIDLRSVVRSALDLTVYALRSGGVTVRTDFPSELPLVAGDADQLIQLALNLIVNADHALRSRGAARSLTITARQLEHSVQLSFSDNGPGVSDLHLSRIFDPFFTTKPVGEGTGIGLSICQNIVRQHGGVLAYQPTIGGGATFNVTFPLGVLPSERPDHIEAREQNRSSGIVLIVDDEKDIAESLREIALAYVDRVDIASDGQAALELIEGTRYDLVVTDLRMPELDGPGLWVKLKMHPHVPKRMAFVTGDALDVGLQRFLDRIGAQLLEKPFTPSEARHFIQSNLELARTVPRDHSAP